MIKIASRVRIDLPTEHVWDFLMENSNDQVWQAGLLGTRVKPSGPTQLGSRYFQTRQLIGQQFEVEFKVTEFEPPTRSTIELMSGPLSGRGHYNLEEFGDRTILTMSVRLETHGFFKLGDPVLRRIIRREIQGYLGNLKDLIEATVTV